MPDLNPEPPLCFTPDGVEGSPGVHHWRPLGRSRAIRGKTTTTIIRRYLSKMCILNDLEKYSNNFYLDGVLGGVLAEG